MKNIVYLLIGLCMTAAVFAGPPKDAERVMRPYPSICTPTLESLIGALTEDYAVHVSITFEESPSSYVMIVENPDTNSMAIVHIDTENERACLVFSGIKVLRYVRPEGMKPPKVDIYQSFSGEDT